MKVNDPKITNYQVCTFKECTQNSEFNKVLIKENIDVRLDLTDYSFDECIFENIDFSNIDINDIQLMDVKFINCDLSNKHFNFIYKKIKK